MSKRPIEATSEASSPKPLYSRARVDAAGDELIAPSSSLDELRNARSVVNNWRAAHSLPLDCIRTELQQRVAGLGEEAVVAARLKRLSSIEAKLRRFRSMRLGRMQDVGGCRVVLPSVADVLSIAGRYGSEPSPYAVIHSDDYIAEPRASGEVAHGVDAVARLERYRETLRVLEGHVRNGKAEYFHIIVDSMPDDVARVRWNEYAEREREEAILAFEEVEAAIEHFPGADTVLVRVASVDALRDAYPSYFADTRVFVDQLKCAIG